MNVRFLLDENLPPFLKDALVHANAAIDVIRIGDETAPPFGTSDPVILQHLTSDQRALVTDNRSTMPEHARDHLAAGHHHWGIFEIRPNTPYKAVIEELFTIWEASEAEEWIDQLVWIPL
jgi:hypothetical protein